MKHHYIWIWLCLYIFFPWQNGCIPIILIVNFGSIKCKLFLPKELLAIISNIPLRCFTVICATSDLAIFPRQPDGLPPWSGLANPEQLYVGVWWFWELLCPPSIQTRQPKCLKMTEIPAKLIVQAYVLSEELEWVLYILCIFSKNTLWQKHMTEAEAAKRTFDSQKIPIMQSPYCCAPSYWFSLLSHSVSTLQLFSVFIFFPSNVTRPSIPTSSPPSYSLSVTLSRICLASLFFQGKVLLLLIKTRALL